MKFRFFDQSRSVIYSWILSYLLLTLVMLVLTGFVYFMANRAIETEINNSNQLLLESLRNNIDDSLVQVNDLSMEILDSNEIQMVSSMDQQTAGFYYKLYQAAKSLTDYKIIKNPLRSYYIYMERIDRIITPGVVNFTANYYFENISRTDLSYDEWMSAIGHRYTGRYVSLPFYSNASNQYYEVALVRSIPVSRSGEYLANIVVMLDFSSALDYSNENRCLIILDGDKNVLAQSDESVAFDTAELPAIDGSHGMFIWNTANGKEVISYISSRHNDWKYITVTPNSVYWERSSFIRGIMIGEIVLCLLGMGLLAFYFVRRNYNILREITSFVRSQLHSESVWGGNEYEYIQQALSTSFEQKEKFRDKLDKQNIALRTSLFTSLLEGRELSVPLDEIFALCDIDFPHPYYSVIAIYLENVNQELWLSGVEKDFDVFRLAKFAVINIMEEVINRSHSAYIVEVHDLMLCLVNTSMEWGEFHASLNTELTYARDFIAQHFDIDLSLAVGGLHESLDRIRRAHIEAQSAIAYARILGKGKIIFFNDVDEDSRGTGVVLFEVRRQVANHIRLADAESAVDALQDVFRPDYSMSGSVMRFAVLSLAVQLMRSVSEGEDEFRRLIVKNEAALGQMMDAPAAVAMQEPFSELVRSLAEENAQSQEKNSIEFGALVQNYIREHFTDPGLNIGSLAEAIGKSPYYASKMFKAQIGLSILDYINQVRVDAAKVLIQENNLTQEQIAERVGFTNVRTFQRSFKKLEGVSPGKLKPPAPI